MVMILVNTCHNIQLQNYLSSVIQFIYCVNHLPGLESNIGGLVLLLVILWQLERSGSSSCESLA